MENMKNFENSKFCYPGGWSTFAPLKSGLRTEITNGILYLSSCMKSSLFVAFMIKFRQDFTEYQILRKAYENVTFFSVGAVLASL
jgi:hypothetical protein